jgi:hypothetical protein
MSTCLFSHKHQNLNGHVGTVAKHEKHLRAIRLVQNQTTTAVSLLGMGRLLYFRPWSSPLRSMVVTFTWRVVAP